MPVEHPRQERPDGGFTGRAGSARGIEQDADRHRGVAGKAARSAASRPRSPSWGGDRQSEVVDVAASAGHGSLRYAMARNPAPAPRRVGQHGVVGIDRDARLLTRGPLGPACRARARSQGSDGAAKVERKTRSRHVRAASSATSRRSRVDRPQILTIRDMFRGTGRVLATESEKAIRLRRVLQRRRPELSRPDGEIFRPPCKGAE